MMKRELFTPGPDWEPWVKLLVRGGERRFMLSPDSFNALELIGDSWEPAMRSPIEAEGVKVPAEVAASWLKPGAK